MENFSVRDSQPAVFFEPVLSESTGISRVMGPLQESYNFSETQDNSKLFAPTEVKNFENRYLAK
jgi:hypothetical protein